MDADWSVEIGPELPVIDGSWEGFVDLRSWPGAIGNVEEAREYPALRDALLTLNGAGSAVFTTKCDAWTIPGGEIDPDEFGAAGETARVGFASYIDVLEHDVARFQSFEFHEQRAREIAKALRSVDLRGARVDMVVRRAHLSETSGAGLTLYVAGCGKNDADALTAWQTALRAAIAATMSTA